MHTVALLAYDRHAVLASADLVALVKPADLARPTACAGWTLADLLAHMTAQHRGFAAAARGHGADPEVWAVSPTQDPVSAYPPAVADVLTAFAGPLEHRFALPEITTEATFAPATAIGFHLLDYVVHSWDVARAIGTPYDPEPDLVAVTLELAAQVPTGAARERPDAAFAPPLPTQGAAPLDHVLAILGRSPTWPD